MLRSVVRFLALVGVHVCCSGFAVVAIVCDLMSVGPHWVTTALSVALFLPMLVLEYVGLGLMERSMPLALVANSGVWVGTFLTIQWIVRACRRSETPGAAPDRG